MRFKFFTEGKLDIHGFEDLAAKKEQEDGPPEDDELPIRSFNVQWMMDVLSRQKIGGRIRASEGFLDHVIWGEKRQGAIRVHLTPNIEVFIERGITDKEGAFTWVLKAVFKPKLQEYAGKEEIVAREIFEHVEKLYNTPVDSASDDYDMLLHLTKRMANRIRTHAPLIYDYQDVKEVNQNYYIIYFSIRNAGVGKLVGRGPDSGRLSPEVTIDVNFNKERGLLHIIMATVSAGGKASGWEVDLPYLDSWFAPSQNRDEIIETVLTALKYY
jgi:hypothetical protein